MSKSFKRPITIDDYQEANACQLGTIYVIDDEPDLLFFLGQILRQEGFYVRDFNGASQFIEYLDIGNPRYPGPRCVLSDVDMPGLSGLDLQKYMKSYPDISFVMMSGLGYVEDVIEAFREGALHFLTKPIDADNLIKTVYESLSKSNQFNIEVINNTQLSDKVADLTDRERQVMCLVAEGLLNKQIGDKLQIAIRTVKIHRHNGYKKLGIKHTAQLAQFLNFFK